MARAAGWTVLGAVAIGASGWALERTTSQLVTAVAAGLLLASIVVTGLFALQVFAPRAWTLRLGGGRLQGHAMGVPVDIELLDVRSMAVERRLGDRALVVETRWRRRALLLPLGADAAAIGRVAAAVTAHGPGAGGDAV